MAFLIWFNFLKISSDCLTIIQRFILYAFCEKLFIINVFQYNLYLYILYLFTLQEFISINIDNRKMSIKNFDILSQLGSGAFASVFKVRRHEDQQIYALKKVKLNTLNQKQKENALNEIRILASIKNPNIIAYKQSFLDKESGNLCLITEYADNGDIEKMINNLKQKKDLAGERQIWLIFIQIANALKSLHALNIAHRDLKSANVFLFKDGKVKIGDMNVSKVIKNNLCLTQTGTPYYASPQIWKDIPYNTKSDIWSLGCLIYQIATLKPPFMAQNMEGLYKKVLKGIYPKLSQKYSKSLKNLIRMMLQVDPESRPNIIALLEYAQNSFKKLFTNQNRFEQTQRFIESAKKIEDKCRVPSHKLVQKNNQQEDCTSLLDTIKFPKKLIYLGSKLPKSNYQTLVSSPKSKKQISMNFLPSISRKQLLKQTQYRQKLIKVKSQKLLPLPLLANRQIL